jgi:hypothetical protein
MEILPSGKFFAINFRKECVDNNLKTNKIWVCFDNERKNETTNNLKVNDKMINLLINKMTVKLFTTY